MKKYAILTIIVLFVILFSILFFKIYQSNTRYSNADIYALVHKGVNNMQDMQNVCIERKNEYGVEKSYYKTNKMKTVVMSSSDDSLISYTITDLDARKQYSVSDKKKIIAVQEATTFNKGLQYQVWNEINVSSDNIRRELEYIKDEDIEGKNCIFVKEVTYYKDDNGTFQSDSELNTDVRAYWIEKSTGFVLGGAIIKPNQTDAIPQVLIKNITFGEVTDNDFNLPNDYEVYDSSK